MGVGGKTKEVRDAKRLERTRQRRVAFFLKRMQEARNGRVQLQEACYFAQAVGDELPDDDRRRLAAAVARAVEGFRL